MSFEQLHQEPNVPSLVTLDSSFDINVTLVVPPLHYVNLLYQLDNVNFSGYPTPDSGNPLSPLEYLAIHAEYLYHTDSIVNGVINSTVPETQCNVFAIHEALAIVAQSITNDSDPSKNGTYQWNGGDLTKSDYDPLTQAKNYADENALFKPVFLTNQNLNDLESGHYLIKNSPPNWADESAVPLMP